MWSHIQKKCTVITDMFAILHFVQCLILDNYRGLFKNLATFIIYNYDFFDVHCN